MANVQNLRMRPPSRVSSMGVIPRARLQIRRRRGANTAEPGIPAIARRATAFYGSSEPIETLYTVGIGADVGLRPHSSRGTAEVQ